MLHVLIANIFCSVNADFSFAYVMFNLADRLHAEVQNKFWSRDLLVEEH